MAERKQNLACQVQLEVVLVLCQPLSLQTPERV